MKMFFWRKNQDMRRYRNLEDSATMRVKDKQIMCSCKFKRISQMRSAIRALEAIIDALRSHWSIKERKRII